MDDSLRFDFLSGKPTLLVAWRTGTFTFKAVKLLTDGEVDERLRSICQRLSSSLPEGELETYSSDQLQIDDNCIEIPFEELMDQKLLERLMIGPSTTAIAENELNRNKYFFCYAVTFGEANNLDALFVNKVNPFFRPALGRTWFKFSDTEYLERVEPPDLQLEESFDLMILPKSQRAFTWDKSGFERLFKHAEIVNAHVPSWVAACTRELTNCSIDHDALSEAAATNSYVRNNLQAAHKVYKEYPLTTEKLLQAIESAGLEDGKFVSDGLLTVTRENAVDFVKLINEKFYKGLITGRSIESQGTKLVSTS